MPRHRPAGVVTRRHGSESESEARPKHRPAARDAGSPEKKSRGTAAEAPSSSSGARDASRGDGSRREARLKRRSAAREAGAAPPPEKKKSGGSAPSSSGPRAAPHRPEVSRTYTGGDRASLSTSAAAGHDCLPLHGDAFSDQCGEGEAASNMTSPSSSGTSSGTVGTVSSMEDAVHTVMAEKMRKIAAAYAINKKYYAQLRQRQADNHNITVEKTFCNVNDGSLESLEARKAALLVSKSVVSLSSFSGEKRIRVCSGFVVRWNYYTSTCLVLTSATLVRSPGSDNSVIPDLRVKVLLPSGCKCDGLISMVDFHHNIVMVEITSNQKLPEAVLCHDIIDRGEVLALGRFYDGGDLMCSRGNITKQASNLDCSELLVSSCNITMAGVGGPLANYSGSIIGMNCYEKDQTPFLSMAIVSRCLAHFQNYGKIFRPWLGFQYTSLEMVSLHVLEHVYLKFEEVDKGLYITNVAKGSPADLAGLCVGDVLIQCAGEVLTTVSEFGALLLDICEKQHLEKHYREGNITSSRKKITEHDNEDNITSSREKITLKAIVRQNRDGITVKKTISADMIEEFNYNRWPAPVPTYKAPFDW